MYRCAKNSSDANIATHGDAYFSDEIIQKNPSPMFQTESDLQNIYAWSARHDNGHFWRRDDDFNVKTGFVQMKTYLPISIKFVAPSSTSSLFAAEPIFLKIMNIINIICQRRQNRRRFLRWSNKNTVRTIENSRPRTTKTAALMINDSGMPPKPIFGMPTRSSALFGSLSWHVSGSALCCLPMPVAPNCCDILMRTWKA